MPGFGPFKPTAVFPRGWYFKPVRVMLSARPHGRQDRKRPSPKLRSPIAVQPAGWYFKPVLVLLVARTGNPRNAAYAAKWHSIYEMTKAVIPTNTVAPVASGTAQNGQPLSTTDGTWTGTATVTVGSAYQWQTASDAGFTTAVTDIGGATASSYLLTAAEIGLYVRCVVSAVNIAAIGLGYSNALGPVIA